MEKKVVMLKSMLEIEDSDSEPKVSDEATGVKWSEWAQGKSKTTVRALYTICKKYIGKPLFGVKAEKCDRLMRWAVEGCSE